MKSVLGKVLHDWCPAAAGAACFLSLAAALVAPAACAARADAAGSSEPAGDAPRNTDAIAAELANPNTALGSLNFNFDWIGFAGDLPDAGDQSAFRLGFQPVLPLPLSETVNFFLRPLVPVVFSQDVPTASGYESPGLNLGDIGFDAAIGKSLSNGMVLVGGLVGTMPTATNDLLGNHNWALGPEALLGCVRKWGALGVLVSQQWKVGGDEDHDTNVTGGQYFYVFNLGEGWQISGSPTYSYNHKAPSGQNWTLPFGGGVAKTAMLGKGPWKFSLQYWHYFKKPDAFGPGWQVRFTVTPVVPLPWGG